MSADPATDSKCDDILQEGTSRQEFVGPGRLELQIPGVEKTPAESVVMN